MSDDQFAILEEYISFNVGKAISERIIQRVFVNIVVVGKTVRNWGCGVSKGRIAV